MIEQVKCFKVGQQFFPTIAEAQKQELAQLLYGLDDGATHQNAIVAAELILSNQDKVLDILTMTPASRPRARKINGGKKTRKSKNPEPQAQP